MSTGKGRIRASTENGGFERIPEMWDPGEYWEGRNLGEYQRRVRASTGKVEIWASSRKVEIRASARKIEI